jgi:hypothetical protein
MKNAARSADVQACPNCSQDVTVPKSTRSFICRHCDAIIKVIEKDDGVDLKVVGKSVEEDPTYQALEVQVRELKTELAEMHKRYEAHMAEVPGTGGGKVGWTGVLLVPVGLAAMLFSLKVGGLITLLGLVCIVGGFLVRNSARRAHLVVAAELGQTITTIGSQRDLLQRKAARLKTEV